MAKLYKQGDARLLGLPGRKAQEIVSGERGAQGMTLRLVEIPAPQPGDALRPAHHHSDFEECIYTLSGQGTTFADSGEFHMRPGDTLLIIEPGTPAGYARMIALRSQLIASGAHVAAPCPHQAPCPLATPDWCHFAQRLPRSRAHK